MLGEFVTSDGIEYEVVWAGGELLSPRETLPGETWTPPTRLYKKDGVRYNKDTQEVELQKDIDDNNSDEQLGEEPVQQLLCD